MVEIEPATSWLILHYPNHKAMTFRSTVEQENTFKNIYWPYMHIGFGENYIFAALIFQYFEEHDQTRCWQALYLFVQRSLCYSGSKTVINLNLGSLKHSICAWNLTFSKNLLSYNLQFLSASESSRYLHICHLKGTSHVYSGGGETMPYSTGYRTAHTSGMEAFRRKMLNNNSVHDEQTTSA